MTIAPRLLVTLTCAVAATGHLGAVTPRGVAVFVLPAALLGCATAAALGRRERPGATLLAAVAVALAWGQVANLLSGTSMGPAARASFVTATLSGLAVTASRGPAPALFLLPVAGVLSGALALGAGGEVAVVAVGTALVAALALWSVDRASRGLGARPASRVALALGLAAVLTGSAAALAVPMDRPPVVLFPGQTDASVRSGLPPLLPDAPAPDPPRQDPEAQEPEVQAPGTDGAGTGSTGRRLLAASVLVLAAVLLVLGGRLLAVRLAWHRYRRECDTGDLPTRTTGAWIWVRARLLVLGVALPPDLSPDRAPGAAALQGLPEQARTSLVRLAPLVVQAGFTGRGVSRADHRSAWECADSVTRAVRTSAGRWPRLLAVLRRPQRRRTRL